MSVSSKKYSEAYYKQVLDGKRAKGSLAKVFDIIEDLSDRRGLRQEWDEIDGDVQDEIIETWQKIIDKK